MAEAYAAGRGVIYLSPHLGGFELCAQDAARRWGDLYGPITVLYRPARQAWLARMMETARNRPAIVELLLARGAASDVCAPDGRSALDMRRRRSRAPA